jgi:hypothetical protein
LLESGAPFPIAVVADRALRARIHQWGGGPDAIRSVGISYPDLDLEVYTYGYVLWGGPMPTWRDLPEMLESKLAFNSGAVRRAMNPRTAGHIVGEQGAQGSAPRSDSSQGVDAVIKNFRSQVESQREGVSVDGVVQEGLTVATPGNWMTGLGYGTAENSLTIVLSGRGDPKPVALTLVDRLSAYVGAA